MSKRRLKREIEALTEDRLTALDPDERLQLFFEVNATGNDHQRDRLLETCPQATYLMNENRFVAPIHLAIQFAYMAVYELHTTVLEYEHYEKSHFYQMLLNWEHDEELSEEECERNARRLDARRDAFKWLYMQYHANRRFAEEILGVDLETWLAVHYQGRTALEFVEMVLENQGERRSVEKHLNASRNGNDEQTLDDLADLYFEGQVRSWNEFLENALGPGSASAWDVSSDSTP